MGAPIEMLMSPAGKRDRLNAICDDIDVERRLIDCGWSAFAASDTGQNDDRQSEAVKQLLKLVAGKLGDTVQALERDMAELAG